MPKAPLAPTQYAFFLGGHDLEMLTIKDLIQTCAPEIEVYDAQLSWGAVASSYADEIRSTVQRGLVPVLVELDWDLNNRTPVRRDSCVEIDHHNERAGASAPTSLHQVFNLLKIPSSCWTRWHDLVAANDRGHIAAMKALTPPATMQELIEVRRLDRTAQGVSTEEESQARQAISGAQIFIQGRLTVVHIPHDRSGVVADLMELSLGGSGYENLLVRSPHQWNFYGAGDLVLALNRRFPGGWYGGALPARGYWGTTENGTEVDGFLREVIELGNP